jgi:hypothetical protein
MKKSEAIAILFNVGATELERRMQETKGNLSENDCNLLDALWRQSHTDGVKYNREQVIRLVEITNLEVEAEGPRPQFADEAAAIAGTEVLKALKKWPAKWGLAETIQDPKPEPKVKPSAKPQAKGPAKTKAPTAPQGRKSTRRSKKSSPKKEAATA